MKLPVLNGLPGRFIEPGVAGTLQDTYASGLTRRTNVNQQNHRTLLAGDAGCFRIFGRLIVEFVGPGINRPSRSAACFMDGGCFGYFRGFL